MQNKEQLYKFLLFFVSIIWGLGFPLATLALQSGFSPTNIIFFRFFISAVVLSIIFNKNLRKIKKITFIGGPIIGAVIFTGFYLQISGQALTSIANTAFITQLNIVIIPIIWALIKRERIRVKSIITTLVALLGLYFLSLFGKDFGNLNAGDLLVFLGAILISIRIIFGSLFQAKFHSNAINLTIVSAFTIAVIAGTISLIQGNIPALTLANFWPLIFLGVVNSAIGYLIQTHALDYVKPETMGLILSFESVVGTLASIFILNQSLDFNIIIGGGLILAAIIYSNLKIKQIRQRRAFIKGIKED
jgi:drug/metabolite transporter (DMT)-like permease